MAAISQSSKIIPMLRANSSTKKNSSTLTHYWGYLIKNNPNVEEITVQNTILRGREIHFKYWNSYHKIKMLDKWPTCKALSIWQPGCWGSCSSGFASASKTWWRMLKVPRSPANCQQDNLLILYKFISSWLIIQKFVTKILLCWFIFT